MGEIHFADGHLDLAIPEFQRVMYGFNAEKRYQFNQKLAGKERIRGGEVWRDCLISSQFPSGKTKGQRHCHLVLSICYRQTP